MNQAILDALAQLDASNDEHWTAEGLPRLAVMDMLLGAEGTKRADVTAAAPGFNRKNLELPPERAENGGGDQTNSQTETAATPPDEGNQEDGQGHTEITEGERAVAEAKAKLEAALAVAAEAQKAVDEANAAHDAAILKHTKPRTHLTDTEDRMRYIRSQQEQRARRAGIVTEALGGLKPDVLRALDPRSKLDQAMQRNRNRGQQRPSRPLVKE